MNKSVLKQLYPHLAAIGIFIVLAGVYLLPALSGKVTSQQDINQFRGAYQEEFEYMKKTGEKTMWTNSMFGGMPTYTISGVQSHYNVTPYVDGMMKLWLPSPVEAIFILMLGFYFMLITFGMSSQLAIIGAVAYAFSSYNFINIDAGHITKVWTIAYMPLVITGLNIIFRYKNYLFGAFVTGVGCALEINAGHYQIVYYTALIVLIWGIVNLVYAIREKTLKSFLTGVAFAIGGAALGVGTCSTNLLVTEEYSKYTQRAPSELSSTDGKPKSEGLNKDYALEYSYDLLEPLTILIPNLYGGASVGELGTSSETYKLLKQNGVPNAKAAVERMPLYWGELRYTAGPTYLGALVCYLFVLGLFIVKRPEKWWLLAGALLSILLSYGRNFMLLTDLFFNYVPAYNKFRSVTFILVITQFCFATLGILALKDILEKKVNAEEIKKGMLKALYITGGIALFFVLLGGMFFDYVSPADSSLPEWLHEAIRADRQSLQRMDGIKALLFIGAGFVVLWQYLAGKLKMQYVIPALGLILLIDLWMVDKKYFNDKDFVSKKQQANDFAPTPADQVILQDTTQFRVFNVSNSPFNEAVTSYHHHSIGGYSAAKLRRYQDLVERQIGNQNMAVLNMLNTRYFIVPDSGSNAPQAQMNPGAMGNVWFVPSYKMVPNADAEMNALNNFNPAEIAFVDARYDAYMKGLNIVPDSAASIRLAEYRPNHLTYESSCSTEQFAIFSEIHYDKGWNAYLDGNKVEHVRANYVLRAMRVPAGKHKIEFKFEPATYEKAEKMTLAFNSILYLGFVISAILGIYKKMKGSPEPEAEAKK